MTLVDLFCGCGGFSLGAHRAGYEVAVAVDIDPVLTTSYRFNFPSTTLLQRDICQLTGAELVDRVSGEIQGVFGGPPCQGFSEIGRRDDADPRRNLVGQFFRIVAEIKPKFFVMENVRGLMFRNSRPILDRGIGLVSRDYMVIGPIILSASQFGAATKRDRLFVFGFRKDLSVKIDESLFVIHNKKAASVREAIADLSEACFTGIDDNGFDQWRRSTDVGLSDYARRLVSDDLCFSGHRIVSHKRSIAERFSKIPEGHIDTVGRHPRLAWEGQCPTLRAGTGPDKGSRQSVRPIHPSEPRVITVREAARLQGFPDSFKFHPTTWHSFRMIGNSVSPIAAEGIFSVIANAF